MKSGGFKEFFEIKPFWNWLMVTKLAIGAHDDEPQGDRADLEQREGSNAVMEGGDWTISPSRPSLGKIEGELPTTGGDKCFKRSISLMTSTGFRVMMV